MTYIVAIGGGEIGERETEAIDRHLIDLTGKENPNVLFLPTASRDEPPYIDKFAEYYVSLGAIVSVLTVAGPQLPSDDEIDHKIGTADAAYAGGGSLFPLLEHWQDSGVDEKLRQRAAAGIVLGGLSAGANCWFEHASSSSRPGGLPEDGSLRIVQGLAIARHILLSPHFLTARQSRQAAMTDHLGDMPAGTRGVGIDDWAAYVTELDETGVSLDEYAVASRKGNGVHVFTAGEHGSISSKELGLVNAPSI